MEAPEVEAADPFTHPFERHGLGQQPGAHPRHRICPVDEWVEGDVVRPVGLGLDGQQLDGPEAFQDACGRQLSFTGFRSAAGDREQLDGDKTAAGPQTDHGTPIGGPRPVKRALERSPERLRAELVGQVEKPGVVLEA